MIRHCLEKKPLERFQSARDLAFDLKALLGRGGALRPAWAQPMLRIHPGVWIATPLVLLLAVIAVWHRTGGPEKAIDSLAVLPLVNASGEAELEYLADGITESLINNLSQLPQLRVMARGTVFSYKSKQVDPRKAGQEMGVRAVVSGRMRQLADTLIIGMELVSVADGSQLWGEQYSKKLSEILTVQSEIAQRISEKLRFRLSGGEQKRLTKRYTENTEAYRLYLKGRGAGTMLLGRAVARLLPEAGRHETAVAGRVAAVGGVLVGCRGLGRTFAAARRFHRRASAVSNSQLRLLRPSINHAFSMKLDQVCEPGGQRVDLRQHPSTSTSTSTRTHGPFALTFATLISNTDGEDANRGDAQGQNQYNRALDKAVGIQDTAHNAALMNVYELPIGRTKQWLSQSHPVVNGILGNWRVSGVHRYVSDTALGVTSGQNFFGAGNSARASFVSGPPLRTVLRSSAHSVTRKARTCFSLRISVQPKCARTTIAAQAR